MHKILKIASFRGTSNILNQPEFKDVEKLKHLLTLFEEGERLTLLLETSMDGLSIRIGTENVLAEMKDCSLITASYSLHGRPQGQLVFLVQPGWNMHG